MQTGFARLAPFSGYKGIFLLSILILLLIAVLTAVDQFIKMTVITNLKPIGSVTCIPGLLEFRYLENNGAAFRLFCRAFVAFDHTDDRAYGSVARVFVPL